MALSRKFLAALDIPAEKIDEIIKAHSDTVEALKEERDYVIQGLHGEVHIHTKDGAIAVIESNCPHQDCVHTGYVSETNRPIICAYNGVYIVIEGTSDIDVEIR